MTQYRADVATPVGKLTLVVSNHGLVFVSSPDAGLSEINNFNGLDEPDDIVTDSAKTAPYVTAVEDYFNQRDHTISVPISESMETTALQHDVWQTLRKIPSGERWSYTQVAQESGHPTAIRAVASAVAKNPILIVTPCHRVVRKNGQVGEYRGGTQMKSELLDMEAR